MTPQPDALPACVHGHNAYIYNHGDYWTVATTPVKQCSCIVRGAPNRDMAIAAWTALCAPHALAASRAEVERLREAAANVAEMYQTDPLSTVDGLTDTEFLARINTLRAAIKAACSECDGTGQGEPSWDGEKYSPRDCAKCGGSDAV